MLKEDIPGNAMLSQDNVASFNMFKTPVIENNRKSNNSRNTIERKNPSRRGDNTTPILSQPFKRHDHR
jgi:hypothetical protein